ncbi:MAG: sulfatase-like hydrolase/transferase, partial [Chromatiales bacterium]|nr:sulfatase-like hydrolase/transferase [Chromatiales bacterium]
MTDQHRPDLTGFGGNSIVKTPNLDALASRSMQFDQAYVANPICMPNRSTIFTGRMPSLHGTRFNGIPLDPRVRTFPSVLRAAGYRTAHIGKCHLQNMGSSPEQLTRALPNLPDHDARIEALEDGWDGYELVRRHNAERVEMPDDYYGFEHVDLSVGHSDGCAGHYHHWALDKGVDLTQLRGAVNAIAVSKPEHHVWRTAVPEEVYPTTYITECTQTYLRNHAASRADEPFYAVCSYPDPHHPFTPPGKYFDMYDPADMVLPETFGDSHERSTPQYQRMVGKRGQPLRGHVNPFAPTQAEYREMAARAYGMVSMVDDGVGRVLQTLRETGLDENTVVIFTSDHGDMFGDHGVMLKGAMHYEGCIRVPLLISAPGKAAGHCDSLVGSIDLAATTLALAGLEAYQGLQSIDLTPLLDQPSLTPRLEVLIEEDQVHDMVRAGRSLRMRSLLTPDARLSIYAGLEHGELFDRRADPSEMNNLFGRSEGAKLQADMMAQLAKSMMMHSDESPRPTAFA